MANKLQTTDESGFLLTQQERERFITWLRREEHSNLELAKQSERIKCSDTLAKRLRIEASACRIVADRLEAIETVVIAESSDEIGAPIYACGYEIRPNEFRMFHGPTPSLEEMVKVIPEEPGLKSCLLRFDGDVTTILYRWSKGAWVKVDKVKD